LHQFALFKVGLDAFDHGVHGTFRIGLGAAEFLLDRFDEFDFVHCWGVRFAGRLGWLERQNGFPPMSRKLSTVIAPAGKNSRRILV
jgi:hypothetical protein